MGRLASSTSDEGTAALFVSLSFSVCCDIVTLSGCEQLRWRCLARLLLQRLASRSHMVLLDGLPVRRK